MPLLVPALSSAQDWTFKPAQTAAQLAAGDEKLALVRAEVVSAKEDGNYQDVQVKVVRVYSGPKDLVGSVVPDTAIGEGSDFGVLARPKYIAREEFICTVCRDHGKWVITSRFRPGEDAGYIIATDWAVEVEKLPRMTEPDRRAAARKFCEHHNPQVALFGVWLLCSELEVEATRREAAEFLHALPNNPKVAIPTTIEVDRQFVRTLRKDWVGSKPREAFFKRWTGKLSEDEARDVIGYLKYTCQGGVRGLTVDKASDLIAEVILTTGQPKAVRLEGINQLYLISDGDRVLHQGTFDALVRVIKFDSDEGVRQAAAAKLSARRPGGQPLPLSNEQRGVLRELLQREGSPSVVKALRVALDTP